MFDFSLVLRFLLVIIFTSSFTTYITVKVSLYAVNYYNHSESDLVACSHCIVASLQAEDISSCVCPEPANEQSTCQCPSVPSPEPIDASKQQAEHSELLPYTAGEMQELVC